LLVNTISKIIKVFLNTISAQNFYFDSNLYLRAQILQNCDSKHNLQMLIFFLTVTHLRNIGRKLVIM